MKNIAILIYQDIALFELGCAVELFGIPRPEIDDWYRCEVVSFDSGAIKSSCGVSLNAKKTQSLGDYSMLVLPSWPVNKIPSNQLLINEILSFNSQSKTILSFCSGSFLLAELGILKNRQATTHWQYAQSFKQRYRDIEYIDDVLYIFKDHIGTSAGSASAIDLGLAVIRQDYGNLIANKVARRLVMAPHRKGGQSQFVETPMPDNKGVFDKTLIWAGENLNLPIKIDELASKSHMSRRSFDRHFRNIHGSSAKQWLTSQRINLAKSALESNQLSIQKIAETCGFDNAHALRHHFRKALGITPRQYRDQFSSLTNHPD